MNLKDQDMGLKDIRRTISAHRSELAARFNVRRIGIFGSFARNEQRRSSDLDVLVEFRKPIDLFDFIDLEEHLRRLLRVRVDLVSRKALKPHIGRAILREVIYV